MENLQMLVGIVGSRNFNNFNIVADFLDGYFGEDLPSRIVSGGAKGADSLAEKYAELKGIPTLIFKPNWKKFGKSAGYLRNIDIVKNSDLIIAFWDGESKGTKHTINLAKKKNKPYIIVGKSGVTVNG